MGRIAEALKRAQKERTRRREQGATGVRESAVALDGHQPASADRSGRVSRQDDVLSQASVLNTTAPTRPFVVSSSPILPERIDPIVIALHDPQSSIAEKFRSARLRLLMAKPDGAARVFAITSTLPKEGKTVITANLGFSLAELRHLRIAILDFDFRQGGLSQLYQASDKPGIVEVLHDEKSLSEVCLPVVRSNLHLIPTGDLGDTNPSDLLASGRVPALMKEINERFHYALIDTPSAHTFADIGMITPLCDAAVLVIQMGRTPEPVLRRGVQKLQANHVNIVGAILTGYHDEMMADMDTPDDGAIVL